MCVCAHYTYCTVLLLYCEFKYMWMLLWIKEVGTMPPSQCQAVPEVLLSRLPFLCHFLNYFGSLAPLKYTQPSFWQRCMGSSRELITLHTGGPRPSCPVKLGSSDLLFTLICCGDWELPPGRTRKDAVNWGWCHFLVCHNHLHPQNAHTLSQIEIPAVFRPEPPL